jgi:chorismate mutase/prephenate dehydratase
MSKQKIHDLRKKIDEIDDKLIDMLNERARYVIEVGDI